MTSYTVAFLSPDPVTMNLSSADMSQLKTDDDSFDCKKKIKNKTKCYFNTPRKV